MDFDENTFARMIDRGSGDDALRPEHQQNLRRQVLEVFDRAQTETTRPTFFARSLTNWRWIMRHPVSRATAAAIFVLAIGGVALWFHGGGTTPAMADFLDPIIEAKTVKFKMTAEGPGQQKMAAEIMVLAPDRMRMESEMPNKSKMVMILDRDKGRNLALIPSQKLAMISTYVNQPKEKIPNIFLLDLRSQLIEFRDKPDFRREPLGEQDIDGRRAVGYRLSGRGVVLNLWGDPKTGLPVRMGVSSPAFPDLKEMILSNFAFNVDLDESLFSIEPPAGYRIQTTKIEASPADEKDLVETFRRYSGMTGGAFPAKLDLGALMQLSMEHFEKSRPIQEEKLNDQQMQERRQERLDEMQKLTRGLGFVFERLPPEADAHYAGKGVSLGAADTPIFWYHPKDSKKYRVIYADLSVRDAETAPSVPNAQPVLARPQR